MGGAERGSADWAASAPSDSGPPPARRNYNGLGTEERVLDATALSRLRPLTCVRFETTVDLFDAAAAPRDCELAIDRSLIEARVCHSRK